MFEHDLETGNITMHRGDTGAFKVEAHRKSGIAWTAADRMLWTIKDQGGNIVMQRIYRLDDDDGLGNGVVEIQFHNDDTDQWDPGAYTTERRYNVNPRWKDGAPSSAGACIDAMTTGDEMIEGDVVRTAFQGTLTISGILGEI